MLDSNTRCLQRRLWEAEGFLHANLALVLLERPFERVFTAGALRWGPIEPIEEREFLRVVREAVIPYRELRAGERIASLQVALALTLRNLTDTTPIGNLIGSILRKRKWVVQKVAKLMSPSVDVGTRWVVKYALIVVRTDPIDLGAGGTTAE